MTRAKTASLAPAKTAWLTRVLPRAIAALVLAALVCMAPQSASANDAGEADAETEQPSTSVTYLPDVSFAMTDPGYWTAKQSEPDTVLADRATIDALNQAGIDAEGTLLQPLKDAAERYYTAEEQQRLKDAAAAEMAEAFIGQVYDFEGALFTQEDADAILANYPTDGQTPDLPSGYGIVTTHTTMICYPTDRPLMYDSEDFDDDNLYLTALRVNEPVLVRAASVDGRFLLVISSCMQASWVPAEHVAICKDREEWLDAWDIPVGQELVVVGYKVRTEQSRVTPNTANRLLYMGTVLERVDWVDPSALVGTRSPFNNHVAYLPVRNADGSYSKELVLIAESENVSEGYLPLTKTNIAQVAFRALGQMYGWGGMLEANDCSGYVRDVYKCFGLELARNTTWQMNLPVRQYNLAGMDNAHKAAAIAQMPLGTVLFWAGHEMLYLGQENGKHYVISSTGVIGNLFGEEGTQQVKGVVINTLDMIRGNRYGWLEAITFANVPYVAQSNQGPGVYDLAFYENAVTWPNESYDYTGQALQPPVSIAGLVAGEDYTVAYANNVEPGQASVTITGAGSYAGTLSGTFTVKAPPEPEPEPEPIGDIWVRLWGDDAYGTMDAIVEEGWQSADTVVLATFDGFHDALAASTLAGAHDAPVLLTASDALSETTAARIAALGAKKAIVVGGEMSVSPAVEQQLKEKGLSVERVSGADAQATALAVANKMAAADTCIVATSASFHDALSASSFAYAKGYPIYLTDEEGALRDDTLAAIKKKGFARAVIVGGALSIPTRAESDLADCGIGSLERKWGASAVETSAALAQLAIDEGLSANHMGVAAATTFHDALCGGPLCGKMGSVLVLATDDNTTNTGLATSNSESIERAYVFGGTATLSQGVYEAFAATTPVE